MCPPFRRRRQWNFKARGVSFHFYTPLTQIDAIQCDTLYPIISPPNFSLEWAIAVVMRRRRRRREILEKALLVILGF